jgi:hypothetical protein
MATVKKNPGSMSSVQIPPGEFTYLKDLDVSEELNQAIQRTCQKLGVRAGPQRQRIEEDLKLQYHFGGQDVAYLPSDQGRRLIAAGQIGSEAFRSALERLDPQARRLLIFCSPLPWGESASFLLT